MIIKKGQEFISIQMETSIKEVGRMTINKEKGV